VQGIGYMVQAAGFRMFTSILPPFYAAGGRSPGWRTARRDRKEGSGFRI
jgi:hypothetical protein